MPGTRSHFLVAPFVLEITAKPLINVHFAGICRDVDILVVIALAAPHPATVHKTAKMRRPRRWISEVVSAPWRPVAAIVLPAEKRTACSRGCLASGQKSVVT